MLHETELQRADECHAQRYAQQCEELRQQLEKEKEELRQREHELAKQRQANKLTLYTTSVTVSQFNASLAVVPLCVVVCQC